MAQHSIAQHESSPSKRSRSPSAVLPETSVFFLSLYSIVAFFCLKGGVLERNLFFIHSVAGAIFLYPMMCCWFPYKFAEVLSWNFILFSTTYSPGKCVCVCVCFGCGLPVFSRAQIGHKLQFSFGFGHFFGMNLNGF